MKLSEKLQQAHASGDYGNALEGCSELAAKLEIDAKRYRWLRSQLDRWPAEYNAPHVRISEGYDYAQSSDLDDQIDKEMGTHNNQKTEPHSTKEIQMLNFLCSKNGLYIEFLSWLKNHPTNGINK